MSARDQAGSARAVPAIRQKRKRSPSTRARRSPPAANFAGHLFPIAMIGLFVAVVAWVVHERYTLSLQWPVRVHFQWPLVIAERTMSESAVEAQADQQGRGLSAWQQYACRKFGTDCRLALAIQRAENPQGKCEIYHYNTDGTLDWGYFQINTVHLKRPGLNLRDLLDCRANIDFAYQLYTESRGFTPWSTYNNGRYRQFMSAH